MPIEPLYKDFLKFLERLDGEDPWALYQRLYLQPHERFMTAYLAHFPHLDKAELARRVAEIKPGDYGQMRALLLAQDPETLAGEALRRCRAVLPLEPEPAVYLFVGFFSPDGFTVDLEGQPAIGIGLERFKDFKDLSLLVAHEYCHCAQRVHLKDFISREERPLLHSVVAEGFSVLFTEVVYPQIPLHRHLFLTPERLAWCRENEQTLLELAGADLATEKLVPVLFGQGDPQAGIPPRVGYYIARQMLGHCLSHHGLEEFAREFPGFRELLRRVLESGRLVKSAAREGEE